MGIYKKPTDSKRYVPYVNANDVTYDTSSHPRHCLTNIPFFLAKRIFTIVENENVKEKRFKELKNIARRKIP